MNSEKSQKSITASGASPVRRFTWRLARTRGAKKHTTVHIALGPCGSVQPVETELIGSLVKKAEASGHSDR